jgi:class 3 adenylate cyclase/YHS domain-containing protein
METERTLLIADLSGYTALTETHGAMHASEIVLRFDRMAEAGLEPGVVIVDRVGDQVLCAGEDTHAVLRSALRLCAAVEREPEFLAVQAALHRGPVVERSGRLFGSPVNLTARLAALARAGQILCTEPIAAACARASGSRGALRRRKALQERYGRVIVYELMRVSQPAQPSAVDPVCRMQIEPLEAAASVSHLGFTYHFCSHECARLFREAPESYARLWG